VLGAPPSREAEFTEFVEAASARLLRAALVLLDTREEAEDALQLALLRTYRRWDRARQAPEAYSRTVLVNVCRERWRYRGRHPEVKGVTTDVSPQSVVLSFTEAVDRRHVLVRVLRRDRRPDVLRHPEAPLELAEPPFPGERLPDDQHRPGIPDRLQGPGDRALIFPQTLAFHDVAPS
jgi:DNA-directed RNA polymerase specialized sigma24 family protein